MNMPPLSKFLSYSILLHVIIGALVFFIGNNSDRSVDKYLSISVNVIHENKLSVQKEFISDDNIIILSKKHNGSEYKNSKSNQNIIIKKNKKQIDLDRKSLDQFSNKPKNDQSNGISKKAISKKLTKLKKAEKISLVGLIPKEYNSFLLDNHYIDYSSLKANRIKITPEYPSLARVRGIEGRVVLRLNVDESKKITKITLDSSSGSKILDSAALKAARKIKNTMYINEGKVFPTVIKVPITFSLRSG